MHPRNAWPIPLLLAITVLFYWKLTLSPEFTWIDNPDAINQVLPWLQFQFRAWKDGEFPIWDPFLWGGYPAAGQVQPGILNPINIVYFGLHPNREFLSTSAVNWYFVVLRMLPAIFAYLLCRDLGRSRVAAIAGGTIFALGGFVGNTGWPQMVSSAIWLPLCVLFLLRSLRGERPVANAAAAGMFLGISLLGTHHNVPTFAGIAIGAVILVDIARDRARFRDRAALLVVFGLFAAAASAIQSLPASEFGRLSLRWVSAPEAITWSQPVPYTVHRDFSMRPNDLVGLVVPGLRRSDVFVGLTCFVLACLALARLRDDRNLQNLLVIGLVGLGLALGGESLVHGAIYALAPYVEKARSPVMAIVLTQLGLCVLASFGIDLWSIGKPARRTGFVLLWLAGVVATFVGLASAVRPQAGLEYEKLSLFFLSAAALGGLFVWNPGSRVKRSAALCLILWELYPPAMERFQPRSAITHLALKKQDAALANYLKTQPGRVIVDEQLIHYNFGDWFGVEQYTGYLAAVWKDQVEVQHHDRVQRMLGAGFKITDKPGGDFQEAVFEGPRNLKIYRRAAAMPPVWTAHAAVRAGSDAEAVSRVLDESVDLRTTAVVRSDVGTLETCEGDEPVVRERKRNSVQIEANMRCRGVVILGDAWFPGWAVEVDGREQPLLRVNHVLRGVVVDGGRHEVVFRYRPLSLIAGAITTLAAIFGVVWLQIRSRTRA